MVGEHRARRCQSDDRSQHNKYIPHSNTSRNPDRMQSLAPTVAEVSPSNSRHEMSLPCQSPRPSRATTNCSLEKLHEAQSIAEEESGQAGWAALTPLRVSDSLRSGSWSSSRSAFVASSNLLWR